MANSYTSLFIHIIFSTNNRDRVLSPAVRDRLWPYMGGIARQNRMRAVSIGGTADHAHLLLLIPPVMPVAKAVQLIKGGSSKWLHENYVPLRKFSWQEGYGAFSIGASQAESVSGYIARQEEHHRIRTFQEEYLAFLKEYNVEYDERYVWG
jgi:REP element-mobilizing transposase RayT